MKISKEARAGILAILIMAAFVWLVQFLKGTNLFNSGHTFYAVYDDVTGVSTGTSVKLNGQKVGTVTEIHFHPDNSGRSVVELNVETDFPLNRSFMAEVGADGFLDATSISLMRNPEATPAMLEAPLEDGDTLVSQQKSSITNVLFNQLNPVKDQLGRTMGLLDSALINIAHISDHEMKRNITSTAAQLQTTLKGLNQAANSVTSLVNSNSASLKATMNSFDQTAKGFNQFGNKLNQLPVDDLMKKVEETLATTNDLLTKMKDNKGTLGKLMNDDALYNNLAGASKEMELLLNDFKNNPKRYVHFSVFGRKQQPYSPRVDTVFIIEN